MQNVPIITDPCKSQGNLTIQLDGMRYYESLSLSNLGYSHCLVPLPLH